MFALARPRDAVRQLRKTRCRHAAAGLRLYAARHLRRLPCRVERPEKARVAAQINRDRPVLATLTLARQSEGRRPHAVALTMSGEFVMDCGLSCPPSCHGKVMLVVCIPQLGLTPEVTDAWSFCCRTDVPQWNRPVYCSGASETRRTRARASKAEERPSVAAGFCNRRRTKPAISKAMSASVKAARHALLFSSSTARYRSINVRFRLRGGSAAGSGGEVPAGNMSLMCCDMTIPP